MPDSPPTSEPRHASPKLFLHIGRNKVGSTSLQDYIVQNRSELRAAGVQYASFFGQPKPDFDDIPAIPTHTALIGYVRSRGDDAVLISYEGLSCVPEAWTRVMAAEFAALNTKLILYVRPYRQWVVSSYMYDTRIGMNGRDFDRYLDHIRPSISFWPMLEIWGGAIGWSNIHVRSIDPRDLAGGDIRTDLMSAIGVAVTGELPARRANASPSWSAVEVFRLVMRGDAGLGWDQHQVAITEALHEYIDTATLGVQQQAPVYLQDHDAQALAALYNADLAALQSCTGTCLQRDGRENVKPRAFLPTAEYVPKSVLHHVRNLATTPQNALLHPETAAFVESPGFLRLFDA